MRNTIKCLSLFSSAGLAEANFKEIGIEVGNALKVKSNNSYKK